MQNIELDRMNRDELVELRKRIDKAISSYEKRKREEALAAVEAAAREHGLTLSELVGPNAKARAKNPPKYRHPEDHSLTWSGRGRQPAWIKTALREGRDIEEFRI